MGRGGSWATQVWITQWSPPMRGLHPSGGGRLPGTARGRGANRGFAASCPATTSRAMPGRWCAKPRGLPMSWWRLTMARPIKPPRSFAKRPPTARWVDGVRVLTLEGNRGKGAALLAGYSITPWPYLPFEVLVTLDGDSQHRPADIPRLVQACTAGAAALVIGERFAPGCGPVPWRSRIGNTLATLVLRWRYPACPRDTQSGQCTSPAARFRSPGDRAEHPAKAV